MCFWKGMCKSNSYTLILLEMSYFAETRVLLLHTYTVWSLCCPQSLASFSGCVSPAGCFQQPGPCLPVRSVTSLSSLHIHILCVVSKIPLERDSFQQASLPTEENGPFQTGSLLNLRVPLYQAQPLAPSTPPHQPLPCSRLPAAPGHPPEGRLMRFPSLSFSRFFRNLPLRFFTRGFSWHSWWMMMLSSRSRMSISRSASSCSRRRSSSSCVFCCSAARVSSSSQVRSSCGGRTIRQGPGARGMVQPGEAPTVPIHQVPHGDGGTIVSW